MTEMSLGLWIRKLQNCLTLSVAYMELRTEVLIIGGGLAGLTAAIHLSKLGKQVVLIEKHTYPQHKVCGEYISNEVLPYLQWLDADPAALFPSKITKLQVTTSNGISCTTDLPLGGFGISRYALDKFLYEKALAAGCTLVNDVVKEVIFTDDQFEVQTNKSTYRAKVVVGAFGKRDLLDQKLHRNFIKQKSPWLAVKAHYQAEHPKDLVSLHNFPGGYCGVSQVEKNIVNACYIVNYDSFKLYKNIAEHRKQVLYQNPYLKNLFDQGSMLFEAPMSISQVSFEKKEQVKDHILMIGDTAGLIHPLCGNGMGMAMNSAMICAELIASYLEDKMGSRAALEQAYTLQWHTQFNRRISTGKLLSGILLKPLAADIVMKVLVNYPGLFKPMIRMTHGKPLVPKLHG
jgi:flavin-dependent dehydrogenase